MHFSLIPINIDSTSAVFTSDKNKIGYVFKHFVLSFYGDNDLQNFWSLLLFHVSQILEGDPKKFIGLFKKGYGYKMVFRRHYQHGMSMISRKKNVEDSVLSDQLSLNKKFCTKVLGHHTYNIDQTQIQKINTNLKFELISYVKRTVINPANHCGLNSCFSYDILVGGVKKSYSFRVGHNLTRSINPENSVTNECIPVYPLGINEGQMQYITQNMSIFPPIPTSCFVSNGLSIIVKNDRLYQMYGELILRLIREGKLKPVVYSLFRKDEFVVLSEDKIKDLLTSQDNFSNSLPVTDELVQFAIQEQFNIGEHLFNEATKFIDSK